MVKLVFKTADWDDSILSHNALATETAFLTANIVHEFNRPARAVVILADPVGTLAQKYDVDPVGDSVYIGPGRAYIYDDDDAGDASVFDGRIVNATQNMKEGHLILECEDWLSQLDDDRIDYDMREALDGVNIRESTVEGDTSGVNFGFGGFAPVDSTILYDQKMSWANDLWNTTNPNSYVVFPNQAFGKISQFIGPYDEVVTGLGGGGTDDPANGEENVWDDMTTTHHIIEPAGSGVALVDYYFRNYHHEGSLMQAGTISACRVHLIYSYSAPAPTISSAPSVLLKDQNLGVVWYTLGEINRDGQVYTATYTVPDKYLTSAIICDASSDTVIEINIESSAGTAADLKVYQILLELEVTLDQYSTAISISDTTLGIALTLGVDVEALGIYETCPYSIVRYLRYRIPTIVTNGDTIYTMTANANIEATTGICARNYQGRTRLEILRDLADMDKAVFWVPLGTVDLTWKSTFNNGAPTAMTDNSVLAWQGDYNYASMYNKYIVRGARVGDKQLVSTSSDATSIATYGISKTKYVTNTGLVTERDTETLAAALVARDKDVQLYLEAVIGGLSALRLGSEVAITSTYLGLGGDVYTITHWAFDYSNFRTNIRLQPRASTVGYQKNQTISTSRNILEGERLKNSDIYAPSLYTTEW